MIVLLLAPVLAVAFLFWHVVLPLFRLCANDPLPDLLARSICCVWRGRVLLPLAALALVIFVMFLRLPEDPKIPSHELLRLDDLLIHSPDGSRTIDFIANTGDGFDATFSVWSLIAQPFLPIRSGFLRRGANLMIGGDLMYPHPSFKTYRERLLGPVNAALSFHIHPKIYNENQLAAFQHKNSMVTWFAPDLVATLIRDQIWGAVGQALAFSSFRVDKLSYKQSLGFYEDIIGFPPIQEEPPYAWAIPWNHDALDGLRTFTKEVLVSRLLGGWRLNQTQPYFVLQVPNSSWVFVGISDQLAAGKNPDIDPRQLDYLSKWFKDHPGTLILTFLAPPSRAAIQRYHCSSRAFLVLSRRRAWRIS